MKKILSLAVLALLTTLLVPWSSVAGMATPACLACDGLVRARVLRDEYHGVMKEPLECVQKALAGGYLQFLDINHEVLPLCNNNNDAAFLYHDDTEETMNWDPVDTADDATNNQRALQLLSNHFGTQRLLVVRVSTVFGEDHEASLEQIHAAVFGQDQVSLVEQFRAISHGQLRFVPTTDHPNIANGMLQVEIDVEVAGSNVHGIMPHVFLATLQAVAPRKLNRVADRVLFCLPSGSLLADRRWRAFGYVGGPYSFYEQDTCAAVTVTAHELGHGLGYEHSAAGNDTYGDSTCHMGGSDKDLLAFNGHKHWMGGWYAKRSVTVEKSQQQERDTYLRLVSFVDGHDHPALLDDDAVLVRIGQTIYMQYNRAKSFNAQVGQADTVTITQAAGPNSISYAVAALGAGQSYSVTDSDGTVWFIGVCAQLNVPTSLDYAIVHIRSGSSYQSNSQGPAPNCTNLSPGFTSNPVAALSAEARENPLVYSVLVFVIITVWTIILLMLLFCVRTCCCGLLACCAPPLEQPLPDDDETKLCDTTFESKGGSTMDATAELEEGKTTAQ